MSDLEPEKTFGERVARWWTATREWLAPRLRSLGRAMSRGLAAVWGTIRGARRDLPSMSSPMRSAAAKVADAPPPGALVATADDDVGSIIGRIDTAPEMDLVLVVPREARALRDPMAWPRLVAHMRRRGGTLRVLAARGEVVEHARAAGLRASRSVRGLREPGVLRIPIGSREFRLSFPKTAPLIRGGLFGAAIAAALVAACYYVPSAAIVVQPPSTPFETSELVQLDPIASEPNVALRVIPVTTIERTITTIISTTTTGTTEVGDEPASVALVFTNEGIADIDLPSGTAVSNEGGTVFLTDAPTVIPAGESVSAAATAERPGTATNLAAGEVRLLVGFPVTLTVTNPEEAVGGSDAIVPAIGEEDILRAGSVAEEVLERIGVRELQNAAVSGFVFGETLAVTIVSQVPLGAVGQPADVFLMEYTAVVSALYLPRTTADAFAEQLLVGNLPDQTALLPGTTTASLGNERSFDGTDLTVELVATGLTTRLVDAAELRGALTGVSPGTAKQRLQERLNLVAEPEIKVQPDWLPAWRMPMQANRITITFVGPAPLEDDIEGGDATEEGASGNGSESDTTPDAEADGADSAGRLR